MTLLSFMQAAPGADRSALRRDLLAIHAPALLSACPAIDRLIVSLADVDPGSAEWRRPGEQHGQGDGPPYDAMLEIASHSESDSALAELIEQRMSGHTGALYSYSVTPMPARVDRVRSASGDRSAGVKYIVQCRFHEDLPDSAVKRSWAHHVPLALRIHQGADIYMRYWVEQALTGHAPLVQGVTELHFPTLEDMRTRWFVGERGREEIIQDIGHFLASGTRLYTSEYVLK